MNTRRATGHVRLHEGARGATWYAKFRTPDGQQMQRRLGPAHNGRGRCPDGHLTERMANDELRRLLTAVEKGELAGAAPRSGRTFGDACAEFLRHREVEKGIEASTMRSYRLTVDKTLIPAFGEDTPVEKITDEDVITFRGDLLESGITRNTAHHHMTLLFGVLERARIAKWIQANPAADVERIRVPKASGAYKALTVEQVYSVARKAPDEQYRALFVVAAFTGLRQGELRALKWGDIDYVNAYIHVQRNLPANTTTEKLPKSGKVRSVPLLDQAAVELDTLSRREHFTAPTDYVFVNTFGGSLHGDTMRKAFNDALTAAELGHLRAETLPKADRFKFHDLRHTFGTIGAHMWPIHELRGYMGHADISTTMIYVHHTPRVKAAREASEYVAAQLAAAAESCPELCPEVPASQGAGRN